MNSTRGRIRDPREDILLETNFDEDGALTRAYNQSQNGSSIHQMNRRRPSDHSLDRYSDNTMHGRPKSGNCCKSCITRIPYATMIATVMCFIGVVVFCGTMYRGSSLVIIMLDRVFNLRFLWIEALQMIFIIIGATMGALGLMILFVGFLATGDTRYKVYRAWRARVGGRISCAVCMGITYVLNIVWILTLCFLACITFVFTVFWNMCSSPDVQSHKAPIDLTQFYFFFPDDVRQERLKIQDELEVKAFCKDCVETAEVMFILASVACLLIILSLVHYLICLAANYAHIRDHEKFQELQEIKNLNEMEYAASKERF